MSMIRKCSQKSFCTSSQRHYRRSFHALRGGSQDVILRAEYGAYLSGAVSVAPSPATSAKFDGAVGISAKLVLNDDGGGDD